VSKSWNDITGNNISDFDSFQYYVEQIHDTLGKLQSDIKEIEFVIDIKKSTLKNLQNYRKYKGIYKIYMTNSDKDKHFRNHETEIIIFEAAQTFLSTEYKNSPLPSENELSE